MRCSHRPATPSRPPTPDAFLLCHARDRGASVDQGIRHHEQHQRQRDRHHGAARRAGQTAVTGFPTNPTAGTAYNFTVSATDAYGNVITGYLGTVNLSSTDSNGSISPAAYTFTGADAGTHSFSATLETAGPQSIKASDTTNSINGTETGITVQPASLAKLVVTGFPTDPTAGTAYNFTVSATDGYGNVITGYLGTVDLSSTDSNASFSAEHLHFRCRRWRNAFLFRHARDRRAPVDQGIGHHECSSGMETGITVQAAAARSFTVTGFPANPTAGTAYNVTVTAHDAL